MPARADVACAFESGPRLLMQEGGPHAAGSRLLQVWEVRDDPVFRSQTVPDSEDYRRFRAEVAARNIETDPLRPR